MSQVKGLSHHDELRVSGPGALLEGDDRELTQVDVLLVEEGLVRQDLLQIGSDVGTGGGEGGAVFPASSSVSASLGTWLGERENFRLKQRSRDYLIDNSI